MPSPSRFKRENVFAHSNKCVFENGVDVTFLPLRAKEMAIAIGREATLTLLPIIGGMAVYFPNTVDDDHWLVQAVGSEAADAYRQNWPWHGLTLDFPVCTLLYKAATAKLLLEAIDAGASLNQAAGMARKTRAATYRLLACFPDGVPPTTYPTLDFTAPGI